MAKLSPLQQVRQDHGSKEALVDKLLPKLDPFEEETDEEFRQRLMGTSNKKLLRLHAAHQRLEDEFGSIGALVDAVVELRSPRQVSDRDYKAKLETLRLTRLLDLYDSAKKTQ